MANWCLLKKKADKFIEKLTSGEISPESMNKMSSKERNLYFKSLVGEADAKQINLSFEKKLLNKNEEQALIKWAEEVSGKNTKLRESLKAKVQVRAKEKLKRIFSPEENEKFLNDLADSKLGIAISEEESRTLFRLSKKFEDTKDLFKKNKLYGKLEEIKGKLSGEEKKVVDNMIERLEGKIEGKKLTSKAISNVKRYLGKDVPNEIKDKVNKLVDDVVNSRKERSVAYGNAQVALEDYVGEIKLGIKEPRSLKKIVKDVASFSKSVLAAVDNSFIGRQGIKALYAGKYREWFKAFTESFKVLHKAGIKGEDALKGVKAEIYSRLNARNGIYKKMQLDIGVMEEAFPTLLPEKIPLLGRVFTASNQAFSASAFRLRADLADSLIKKAIKNGVDLDDKIQAESLGKLINSMTGRGKIKFLSEGGQEFANVTLFSPKFLKSNFDTLTAHFFDKSMSKFARKEARMNLLKIIGSMAGILYISDKLQPGSVEWDARSSDFGKIKIGNTRFDISGGMASLVTLAARIGGSKSSATGKITKPSEYGGKDISELGADFFENKTAPLLRTLLNIQKGSDFDRNPLTLEALKNDPTNVAWSLGKGLAVPIPIQNAIEAYEHKDNEPALAAIILDAFGVGANVYDFNDNWVGKTTKEFTQFKKERGYKELKKANKEYNVAINQRIMDIRKNERFIDMSPEDKIKVITKLKSIEKEKIFEDYDFKYKTKKIKTNPNIKELTDFSNIQTDN